jgi:hypothetical protein
VTANEIAANTITAAEVSIGTLSAISADMGTLTAGKIDVGSIEINADTERILMGAASAPLTGTGVFLGKDGSDYEMRVGDPAGRFIHWDGSDLVVNANTFTGPAPVFLGKALVQSSGQVPAVSLYADVTLARVIVGDSVGTTSNRGSFSVESDGQTKIRASQGGGSPPAANIVLTATGTGSEVLVDSPLRVTGSTTLDGSLYVTGTATLGANVLVGGVFTVTGKLTASDEVEIDGALNHDGTTVGFYGAAPVARSDGWAAFSDSGTRKTGAANTITTEQLAQVVDTLIRQLVAMGLLSDVV